MTALGAIGGALIGAIEGNLPEALRIAEICAIPLLVILVLAALLALARRGHLSTQNQYLVLWVLLIMHRVLIQRSEAVDVGAFSLSGNFAEVGITLLIFVGAVFGLAIRLTKEKHFTISGATRYFAAYVVFCSHILSSGHPTHLRGGFWLVRLVSTAIIRFCTSRRPIKPESSDS
jgi:hypothetical protein